MQMKHSYYCRTKDDLRYLRKLYRKARWDAIMYTIKDHVIDDALAAVGCVVLFAVCAFLIALL